MLPVVLKAENITVFLGGGLGEPSLLKANHAPKRGFPQFVLDTSGAIS
jgi:hypothetical protein